MYSADTNKSSAITNNKGKSLPTVFMFSGQGSQHYHMAAELFEKNPDFRRYMQELDYLFKAQMGESVIDRIYHPAFRIGDVFDDIVFTHPAIFMVEYALARTLVDSGIRPDYVLGASLGELAAAAISGVLSVEDAVRLVTQHARLFAEHSACRGGLMAILHDIDIYRNSPALYSQSEIAALNARSHFVIAGSDLGLDAIAQHLTKIEVAFLRLPVKYAFHSSHIDSLQQTFAEITKSVTYHSPVIPLISCAAASMVNVFNAEHLWKVYRGQIRVAETMQYLNSCGYFYYLDLGPGGTFVNLAKYHLSAEHKQFTQAILTPFGQDMKRLGMAITDLAG